MREVAIKGVRQGILLVLPAELAWATATGELDAKLTAAQGLIAGAKAQLDVGDRPLGREALDALLKHLNLRFALEVTAFIGTDIAARHVAEALGLSLSEVPPPAAEATPVPVAMAPERTKSPTAPQYVATSSSNGEVGLPPVNNALYMRQTIRSGQQVRHDGTIVICGDVNPGAEVIATGDIIVFGTLRGVAHAGAAGDEDCQIIAINLRPTQIRIAGYIARSPDAAAPPLSKHPEVARVTDSEIHIIPLREMA